MANQHLVARAEGLRQPLGQIHGTVLAAGASDRNGEIVAIVARIVRQPARDEVVDVAVHPLHLGQSLEVSDHRGVPTTLCCERGLVMRIWEAAHVKYEVGVERYPLLVAEGLE